LHSHVFNVICVAGGVQAWRKGGFSNLGGLKVHYLEFLFVRRSLPPHLQPNGRQGNIKAYLRHFNCKSFIKAHVSFFDFILLQISSILFF